MKKMKIILSILVLVVNGCEQNARKQTGLVKGKQDFQDTLISKHKNILNISAWDDSFYSQSYSYFWLVGKDTLDFKLYITEWERDGTLHLRVSHKEPIFFTEVLEKINACLSLIKEDFNVSKITSIHFREPIFYLDLAKELSSEYEREFGRKTVSYDKLSQFLLKSSLTSQLNYFLNPLNKKVKRYGLEKFQLIDKEHYKEYLLDIDLLGYPEFTLNAHNGILVYLENK